MSLFLLIVAFLFVFLMGFLAGGFMLVIVALNRIDAEGRFDAGLVSIVGYIEHKNDRR